MVMDWMPTEPFGVHDGVAELDSEIVADAGDRDLAGHAVGPDLIVHVQHEGEWIIEDGVDEALMK